MISLHKSWDKDEILYNKSTSVGALMENVSEVLLTSASYFRHSDYHCILDMGMYCVLLLTCVVQQMS